uniref:Uncharacterized protein n=1 Tax=Anguilla anguilla TaxID=7936 RepID=A0A0E9TRN1_ANGAN
MGKKSPSSIVSYIFSCFFWQFLTMFYHVV